MPELRRPKNRWYQTIPASSSCPRSTLVMRRSGVQISGVAPMRMLNSRLSVMLRLVTGGVVAPELAPEHGAAGDARTIASGDVRCVRRLTCSGIMFVDLRGKLPSPHRCLGDAKLRWEVRGGVGPVPDGRGRSVARRLGRVGSGLVCAGGSRDRRAAPRSGCCSCSTHGAARSCWSAVTSRATGPGGTAP